ncbi:PIH1 domain-containing protein 2 [Odontesthes bonariensis]|uniref:PIH1 domain-containing protein 2 n=1 Tax=Odontesthes bonariensis TaxID=219752 RepID=UPI003F584272
MSSAGSTDDVLRQVNQFWSMLDDLSLNDPAAYRKFIKKQMEEGAEFSTPPELHSCLRTQILEPKTGSLYINICSWKRVPAPQDLSSSLPVCAGILETGTKESQGWYAVLDVALNPAVLQGSKADKTDINNVYMLALSFAQQQHGMRLSQEHSVVSCSPKSGPDDLNRRLGFQIRPNISKQPERVSQTPVALLQQISSLQSEKQDEDCAAQIISRPVEHMKKDLIQVISTTFVEPQKPEYQLEVKTDIAGVPHSVELTVELPKVRSVSECQLRVSKDDILLEVEDVYYLLLDLPKTVNEDTASAIFNKKKRRLCLKVDVL